MIQEVKGKDPEEIVPRGPLQDFGFHSKGKGKIHPLKMVEHLSSSEKGFS
jgi:hypothetical protein